MTNNTTKKIGLAITGASGFIYGYRLTEELAARDVSIHLTISPNAQQIARIEQDVVVDLETGQIEGMDDQIKKHITYHHHTHVGAAPASGSYHLDAIAIVPCSMGTLGRIATGTSDDLVGRMADVALKERRKLILVPRETPYNTIQLKNMYELSQSGVIIMPATPGFYQKPKSINDMIDFVVSRILQHLGFDGQCLIQGGWGKNPVAKKVFLGSEE